VLASFRHAFWRDSQLDGQLALAASTTGATPAALTASEVAGDSVTGPIHLPEMLAAMAKVPKVQNAAQQRNCFISIFMKSLQHRSMPYGASPTEPKNCQGCGHRPRTPIQYGTKRILDAVAKISPGPCLADTTEKQIFVSIKIIN
jgi:hypothetical protein